MHIWKCALLVVFALPNFTWAAYPSDEPDEPEAASDELEDLDKDLTPWDESSEHDGELSTKDGPEAPEGEDDDHFTDEQFGKLHAKIDDDNNAKLSVPEILQFAKKALKSSAVMRSRKMLEDKDKDKDNKLTLPELLEKDKMEREKYMLVKVEEEGKFKAADSDMDYKLDELELAAYLQPEIRDDMIQFMAESALEKKDTDNDGLLTLEEWLEKTGEVGEGESESMTDAFKKFDTDGNGKLDAKEMVASETEDPDTEEAFRELMKVADTNRDEQLTIEEIIVAQDKDESNANYYWFDWIKHYEL